MMRHDEFRKGGKVSVWVGDLGSEIELDDYMNVQRAFEKDFGFEINERDMPETKVEVGPVPIADLVKGFSWAESYAQSVNEIAKKQGIEQASTMIIFINFEYDSNRVKLNPNAPVKFLGVASFSVQS